MLIPTLVDDVVYVLITNKYATLKELRDDYSIDEAISLYETCMFNLYNKYMTVNERTR